jgi:hypothetical protein
MYTNIPAVDTITIITNILEDNPRIDVSKQKEIIHILKTVTEQNYFQFDQQYYKQTEGLAMGAPTSAILAETYIQYMEHEQIYPILIKHKIIGYFRFVDDILVIYDHRKTNIDNTLIEFNKQQTNINFTIEKEEHNCINFLDLTIHRKKTKLEFSIYRKHTQTDIIIPNDSCHPHEHKIVSINYLTNRLHVYPLTKEAKIRGLETIKNTLHNNKYNINIDTKQHKKHNTINNDPQHKKSKWAIFTYSGKETRKITNLFRDTEIKIAFRTRNTVQNTIKPPTQTDKYEKSGICQMKCLDCPLRYIGQTGRAFHTRYKENIQAIRSNNGNAGYSNHILNTGHTYGSITGTMDII